MILPKKPTNVFTLFRATSSKAATPGPHHAFCFLPAANSHNFAQILRAPQIKWQHLDETLCPSIRSEKRLGRFDKIDQFYASVCLIWQRCSSFSQKASEDDNYYDNLS